MLAWLALAAALLCVLFGVSLARWRRGLRARRRNRVAGAAERRAESLLDAAGWKVVERQTSAAWSVEVDGELVAIDLQADLLVRARDGSLAIAEVKSGSVAPDVRHGPTRRQLLEYTLAFGTDRVLLVDMEDEVVREVVFPSTVRSGTPSSR